MIENRRWCAGGCWTVLVVMIALGAGGCRRSESGSEGTSTEEPASEESPSESSGELDISAGAKHLAEFREIARRLKEGDNAFHGRGPARRLEARLQQKNLPVRASVETHGNLAMELLRLGDTAGAIKHIEIAVSQAEADPTIRRARPVMLLLYRMRGMVYLRQAENANCVARHNPDCCLFPLRGGGVHTVRRPAELARASYLKYLAIKPDDLAVRWLLNLTSMALGDHPEGVPGPHRIDPSAFASEQDIGRFKDVADALGVNAMNLCGGCVVDDFDGDGLLDIVTSTSDPDGPLTCYRNIGDGVIGADGKRQAGFVDVSASAGVTGQLGGLNCIGADYDNDGDMDVLVLRGAWFFDDGQIRNSLLRNNGDWTFTDVTRHAGLADPARPTQAAAWGDYDNDGDLDLYIGNESRVDVEKTTGDYPSQLFRNNGDGTFTDVADEAGVTNDTYAKGVAAGDYDNDGDLDIYVSNVARNRLYRNDGSMRFTDVAAAAGVTQPGGRSFVPWFFDYDNDGWLDLFVAAYDATVDDVAANFLDLPDKATRPCLYHNNGDGTFRDVAREAGLDHPYLPMGANFGDLDNDGFPDMYLTTGDPDFQTLMPNVMLRNDGGRRFVDVTTSGGFGHLQKGHGVAFADFDHDGDQDIYHQLGGFLPGDAFGNALFLNPGHGNHFLVVKVEGRQSNRSGVGVRITVVLETAGGRRTVHRAVGAVSSFGGSPLRQEIGLGRATRIERLKLWWPASGVRQVFENVPMDRMIRVVEGAGQFELMAYPKTTLGL